MGTGFGDGGFPETRAHHGGERSAASRASPSGPAAAAVVFLFLAQGGPAGGALRDARGPVRIRVSGAAAAVPRDVVRTSRPVRAGCCRRSAAFAAEDPAVAVLLHHDQCGDLRGNLLRARVRARNGVEVRRRLLGMRIYAFALVTAMRVLASGHVKIHLVDESRICPENSGGPT